MPMQLWGVGQRLGDAAAVSHRLGASGLSKLLLGERSVAARVGRLNVNHTTDV